MRTSLKIFLVLLGGACLGAFVALAWAYWEIAAIIGQ